MVVKLGDFNERYCLTSPRRDPANDDELRCLGESQGLRLLVDPPAVADERSVPDRSGDKGCHLWVFHEHDIPYVAERSPAALALESGVAKHTNLTGGAPASCGGELWVDPVYDNRLYVNGCSGRYGPRSPAQLADAEEVFEQLGYTVVSFGWDEEVDLPARVRR